MLSFLLAANDLGTANDLHIPTVPLNDVFKNGLDAVFLVIGALSVIFVIVGGLMYTVSAGDPGRTKRARETIIYALVGMVISLSAFAIVNFLTSNI